MRNAFLRISAVLAGLALPVLVAAAVPSEIWIYCGDLPGCPSGFDERFTDVLLLLLLRLPTYVYILAVLFIMIGGAYMVLSNGDSEKVTKGKNTIIWAVIGVFVMQFAEQLINFVMLEVITRDSGPDLVESVTGTLIGSILDLLYVAIIGVGIYAGMRMVLSFGKEEQFTKARDGLFWCAVGAILINLADAIAQAVVTL